MNSRQHRRSRITAHASIAVLCAGTSLLAGCGGSSSPKMTVQTARQTTAQSNAAIGSARTQARHASQDAQRSSKTTHTRISGRTHVRRLRSTQVRPLSSHARGSTHTRGSGTTDNQISVRNDMQTFQTARQTPAITGGEPTGGGGPQLNPCTLVTLSEAGGMAGPIAGLVEAPKGPTCIYKRGNSKSEITLTVEHGSFSGVTNQMTNGQPFTMGTHSAVCGQMGPQMLFLSLAGGQVLQVTAPCPIAKQFAGKALSRLGG